MIRTYRTWPRYWALHDAGDDARIARLTFHIEQGDYFPFLATVIGFLKETAEQYARINGGDAHAQAAFAEEVRKDLIYLHERYTLTPKEIPSTYSTQKMIRFSHDPPRY